MHESNHACMPMAQVYIHTTHMQITMSRVNFPTQIPDCDSHSPAPFSSDTSICSAMAFYPLGNSDHVVVSVFIGFL